MNMGNNTIGFIGVDYYDSMIYLSKILCNLGKRVLLLDYSMTQSLKYCIPHPSTMDSFNDVIDYMGVDFTRNKNFTKKDNYDYILIFYGLYHLENYKECDSYILVSDIQRHNLEAFKTLEIDDDKILQIVIKDFYDSYISEKYAFEIVNKKAVNKYVIDQDSSDLKHRSICQEQKLNSFKKISKVNKEYLIDTVKALNSAITEGEIKNAYKKSERGI